MKRKQLLTKTLLAVVMLCVGANVSWAFDIPTGYEIKSVIFGTQSGTSVAEETFDNWTTEGNLTEANGWSCEENGAMAIGNVEYVANVDLNAAIGEVKPTYVNGSCFQITSNSKNNRKYAQKSFDAISSGYLVFSADFQSNATYSAQFSLVDSEGNNIISIYPATGSTAATFRYKIGEEAEVNTNYQTKPRTYRGWGIREFVLNLSTGDLYFTLDIVNFTSGGTTHGQKKFTGLNIGTGKSVAGIRISDQNYNNSSRTSSMDNVSLYHVGSQQTQYAYSITYTDGTNTLKTTSSYADNGATVEAETVFWVGAVKYVLNGSQTTSMTIGSGTNELTVTMKECDKYAWTVKASTGTTLKTGSDYANEEITVAYPEFYLDGTTLYQMVKTNDSAKEYRTTFTLNSDNKEVSINASQKATDVVFYAEGEDIKGMLNCGGSNVAIRCSNGKAGTTQSSLTITTLLPGTYTLHTGIYENSSNAGTSHTFTIGSNEFTHTSTAVNQGTKDDYESFTINESTDVVYGGTTSTNNGLDYIYIVGTQASVATPTFTIGSYDYEQGGYAITPACTTEGATLTYTIGGGAATECTNGVPFYAVNGALVVTASKTNWISSSSESATLNSAPAATSPESLIPFSSSTDNYDKNQMHTYKSVSIPGDNFAGINSGTGLKLRTGKTTSIENVTGLQLNVIEGYKVTKVAFSNAYSNNSSTISVNSVYVDGTQLSNFEAKELPATGSTTAFDIDGIAATQSIVIGLGTEANQYRATIEVTYEPTQVTASITSYGYATFSSTYALDFTNVGNAKAYIVTGQNATGTSVIMEQVTGTVAAGTGLVLESNNGGEAKVTIPIVAEGTSYSDKNKLWAITADDNVSKATDNSYTNYVLSVQDNEVVFASIDEVSAPIKAGQAALCLPKITPAKSLSLSPEQVTTGINTVQGSGVKVNGYYDLQGRRVSQPTKGLYIMDGKKIIIK